MCNTHVRPQSSTSFTRGFVWLARQPPHSTPVTNATHRVYQERRAVRLRAQPLSAHRAGLQRLWPARCAQGRRRCFRKRRAPVAAVPSGATPQALPARRATTHSARKEVLSALSWSQPVDPPDWRQTEPHASEHVEARARRGRVFGTVVHPSMYGREICTEPARVRSAAAAQQVEAANML